MSVLIFSLSGGKILRGAGVVGLIGLITEELGSFLISSFRKENDDFRNECDERPGMIRI